MRELRLHQNKSILDSVTYEIPALKKALGADDRAKLDDAGRQAALAHVMANARLMEILAGPDKAEALLNRGVEAVNTA